MAGGRIDIEVALNDKQAIGQLQGSLTKLTGIAGGFGKALGAGVLAGGFAAAAGEVIKVGNDFTNSLNTMQAVSRATAEQMAAVSARAKELGNDIELPNTSAGDAAAAMTELAKGGFSVEQSMKAAKGTLQLAAAAQIDAASAATIQSQALQAFGKDADYAATAADVLANTANASSAEITDVAAGLQQAGTVANQFGVSMEDTATTIGLFANAGITGSDAGTLLKTALLALTDQGKPAQAAISDLGLTIYDTQGKFVGLESLFGQLQTASQRMTPEMYQAATATLFGSDAARLAGVAAQQGAAGYDTMRDAIGRQGAAAEVAAAKTQGLPGAMAQAQNAAENLALQLYDLADGPLESLFTNVASAVTKATPTIIGGLEGVGSAASGAAGAFGSLPDPVKDAAIVLGLGKAATVLFGNQLDAVSGKARAMGSSLKVGGGNLGAFTSLVRDARSAAALSGDQLGRLTASMQVLGTGSGNLARIATSYNDAATNATRFHGAAGLAAGSTKAASVAAGGLMGALGGPWGLAISGAAGLVGVLASKHADAAREAEEQRVKEEALRATLDKTSGKATQATVEEQAKQFQDAGQLDRAKSFGIETHAFTTAAVGLDDKAKAEINARLTQDIQKSLPDSRNFKLDKDSLAGAGLSETDVAEALQGVPEQVEKYTAAQQKLNDQIRASGVENPRYVSDLGALKKSLSDTGESAATLGGALNGAGNATDSAAGKQRQLQEASQGTFRLTEQGAQAFRDLGVTVQSVPDGKTVIIDAPTAEQRARILSLGYEIEDLPDGSVKINADTGPVKLAEEQTRAILDGIDRSTADPQIGAILDKLKEGKAITLADLNQLSKSTADPAVILQIAKAVADAKIVAGEIDNAARDRTSTIHVNTAFGGQSLPVSTLQALHDIPGQATGGRLPSTGPGTEITDGFVGVLGSGRPIVRLDGGEQITRSTMADKYQPELQAINAGTFPKLPGLAEGGRVGMGIDDLLNLANGAGASQPLEGAPYVWGGINWGDCTGAQSAFARGAAGLPPFGGRFATGNAGQYLQQLGFEQGDGGSDAYTVGWTDDPGGPGGGHAVGRIGSTNVEMGGGRGNGQVGGGAAGPESLANQMHIQLGPSYTTPGYTQGSPRNKRATVIWDNADQLKLESADTSASSARTSLDAAKIARDKALADPKKSDAEKAIAEQRVQQAQEKADQAQQRAQALKDKKAQAAGGPAAQAPGLAGSLTDDQIDAEQKDLAVSDANDRRNEVYANPESTDADLRKADLDLQRAINDRNKKPDASKATDSISGALGAVAQEFVTSTVQDILGTFGVDDSGTLGRTIGFIQGLKDYDPQLPSAQQMRQAPQEPRSQTQPIPSDPATAVKPGAITGPLVDHEYDSARRSEQWAPEFTRALQITGNAAENLQRTIQQGDNESSGNPRAVGPGSDEGTPKGVLQVKDKTFAAFRDPSLRDDPFDVLANSVAAMNWVTKGKKSTLEDTWPTTTGYANGGINPFMSASKANVVKPNTWRVVGDRTKNDEFFIPDTNDPQHVAIGREWARRRGYELVRMYAEGGVSRVAPQQSSSPVNPTGSIVVNSYGDHQAVKDLDRYVRRGSIESHRMMVGMR